MCYRRKSKSNMAPFRSTLFSAIISVSVSFYDIANDVLALNDRTDTEEL